MKFNVLRVLLVLFLVFAASGVQAESSVWVVSSPKASVYLAGSMHMLRASDYPLPAEFFSAYQDARRIIFEVPPGEMEKLENAEKFMRASVYGDGTTLREHITSEAYAKIENFCRERNYPLEQYQFLKPTLFMMNLTVLELTKLGADPKKGIDYFFKEKALQDGKEIGSLETVDQQISFLTSMDAGWGGRQIFESIDELNQVDVLFGETVNAWRKGDEAKIDQRYLKRMKESPKLYQTLIADRNKKWAKAIEDYLNGSGNTMVVVGAAHLVGADGVVNLLRQCGYKVVKLNK